MYLLDVNLLIALFDPMHVNHDSAHGWFAKRGAKGWATCPITENGFARITSSPAYPNRCRSLDEAALKLKKFIASSKSYEFWPDSLSILNDKLYDLSKIYGHRQLTDIYLVGLCQSRSGILATFDKGISTEALKSSEKRLIEYLPDSK